MCGLARQSADAAANDNDVRMAEATNRSEELRLARDREDRAQRTERPVRTADASVAPVAARTHAPVACPELNTLLGSLDLLDFSMNFAAERLDLAILRSISAAELNDVLNLPKLQLPIGAILKIKGALKDQIA